MQMWFELARLKTQWQARSQTSWRMEWRGRYQVPRQRKTASWTRKMPLYRLLVLL